MRTTRQLSITLPNDMADVVNNEGQDRGVRERKRGHPRRPARATRA